MGQLYHKNVCIYRQLFDIREENGYTTRMRQLPPFYHPIDFKIDGRSVIVYPARDTDASSQLVYGPTTASLLQHVRRLYRRQPVLNQCTFHIIFLWSLNHTRMADVWVFDEEQAEYDSSGAVIRAYIFKEFKPCAQDEGLASNITLPVLGAEAALRRDITDLERYAHSPDIYPAIPGLPLTPKYGDPSV